MTKTGKWARTLTVGVCLVAMLVSNVAFPALSVSAAGASAVDELIGALDYQYADYKLDKQKEGFTDYTGEGLIYGTPVMPTQPDTELPPEGTDAADVADATDDTDQNVVQQTAYQTNEYTVNGVTFKAVTSDADQTEIVFEFDVPEKRFYQMGATFLFVDSKVSDVFSGTRKILIDGESVYLEADNIELYRLFTDDGEATVNRVGDEVKPFAQKIDGWQTVRFYDNMGYYTRPLTFALDAGKHTVTVVYDKTAVDFKELFLEAPYQYTSYTQYIQGKNAANTFTGEPIKVQAEDAMAYRNASAIGMSSDGDPKVEPANPGYVIMNTVGGSTFSKGGQSITFKVTVPKAGYYSINLRGKQSWANNRVTYRRVEINGEVPFAEAECVSFKYSNKWQNFILGDEANGAYAFNLKEGENLITLTVVLGDNTEIIRTLQVALNRLSKLSRDITMIIGNDPDLNYDYRLAETIPDLTTTLQACINLMEKCKADINAQNGGEDTDTGNSLESSIKTLQEMRDKVKDIPKRVNELASIITNVGDVVNTLQKQELQIDYIETFAPGYKIADFSASFWDICVATIKSFLVSFSKDYTTIAAADGADAKVINMWVGRGREWAEIMKQQIDADFTKKTGINVNMNVVPASALGASGANLLLLSLSAGTQPDIAVGVTAGSVIEYAIRGVVEDLSVMDTYQEVISRFPSGLDGDGIMKPYKYTAPNDKGGKTTYTYGIPEQMSFSGMFYRTDIFEEMGWDINDYSTWEEIFEKRIPELNEYSMQFYLPNSYGMFLAAAGGNYYRFEEQTGKVSSALDSKEAYDSFKMLTDAFLVHGVPTAANFFNRFRTGEMPVGMSGKDLYLQLVTAAPELNGKWAMVPIPGYDTVENKTYVGMTGAGLMILKNDNRDRVDWSWDFIDWWTSEDVQITYAVEVESRIGMSARWVSSNMEAFKILPWGEGVLEAAMSSWDQIMEFPAVLGGYYIDRHITNAWNNTVLQGMTPRESLEEAVEEINKELNRKWEQVYGK